jgi:hypothetical protein
MCVGMGGMMWFMSRFSNKKNKGNQKSINHDTGEAQEKELEHSCCVNLPENNETQNTDYQSTNSSEGSLVQPSSRWPRKYEKKQYQQQNQN